MGRENTKEIFTYLRSLAPEFFNERMRGASAEEIAQLENVARTPLTESHREFLAAIGATPAQALNPFLNDRDYCVETLLSAYAELDENEERLPPNIVYFSSSEILGENIFLRQAESLDLAPEIGDIRFETGEFISRKIGRFESWLRWFAFVFRISQPEYQFELRPPWDATAGCWRGEPLRCWKLLEGVGFKLIFSLEDGTRCADSGGVAAIISPDGSGTLAGDDLTELVRLQVLLNDHIQVMVKRKPEDDRMRAPRK